MTRVRYILAMVTNILCLVSTTCYAELADPTRPPRFQAGKIQSSVLELSAIFFSKTRRFAVINGQFVHEGDSLNDARIISIKENRVEVEGPQGKFTLILLINPSKRVN